MADQDPFAFLSSWCLARDDRAVRMQENDGNLFVLFVQDVPGDTGSLAMAAGFAADELKDGALMLDRLSKAAEGLAVGLVEHVAQHNGGVH